MKQKWIEKLKKGKPYREAFVTSQISVGIPFQIRALREQRGLGQKQLAEAAGMLQPRISAMEKPGNGSLNLETLKRLAGAFDVGLIVKFVPFTELTQWADDFSPDTFFVASFEDEEAAKPSAESAVAHVRLAYDNSSPSLRIEQVRNASIAKQPSIPVSNTTNLLKASQQVVQYYAGN
ncbi:MAG: helix-turn-helix transcriptional regulator [Acidobacteria bacterium]|nr:helix-turn-helix transcriptional regulator [Acidobacteriota bacterium]